MAATGAPGSELVMYNPSGIDGVVLIRMPAQLANACATTTSATAPHRT